MIDKSPYKCSIKYLKIHLVLNSFLIATVIQWIHALISTAKLSMEIFPLSYPISNENFFHIISHETICSSDFNNNTLSV